MNIEERKIKSYLPLFIIFLTSFALGFYVSTKVDFLDNISKKDESLVETIIKDKILDKNLNLDLFWKIYTIVKQNYYSSDELKTKDLQYGIIT